MLRIGIIGTESSHVEELVQALTGRDDVQITAAVPAAGEPLAGATIVERPDDLLDLADGFAVFSRDGRVHRGLAEPLLRGGRRVFVDKPFATEVEDAAAMVALADAGGGAVTSFSALRFSPTRSRWLDEVRVAHAAGTLAALGASGKAQPSSPHAGAWFYAPHVTELLAGWWPRAAHEAAVEAEPGAPTATLRWRVGHVRVEGEWVNADDAPFRLWWEELDGARHDTEVPVEPGQYFAPAAEEIVSFLSGDPAPVDGGDCLTGVGLVARLVSAWT